MFIKEQEVIDQKDDQDIIEKNEDAKDSETKEGDGEAQDPSKTKIEPDNDPDKKEDLSNKYRPSDEKEAKKVDETVPLKKYLDLKAKLKEAQSKGDDLDLNKESLEEFAEEAGLQLPVVKKLARLITAQATAEANKLAEEKIKPFVVEKISRENERLFEEDFEKRISSVYPDLANKKDAFKKIAFSKDFIHLKSLDEIREHFYPDSVKVTKEVKKESLEKGSLGGNKETEKIQFATLKENPTQYAKVMNDPVARAKYYEWQDSQGN